MALFRKRTEETSEPHIEVSEQVETVIDGRHVPNLAMWVSQIRDACASGRDRLYPSERFVGYIEDAAKWYRGDHWENLGSGGELTAQEQNYRVENRVAEKVDTIASMLVENRPTIRTLPRTGGDVDKAAQLNYVLDAKLRDVNLPLFLFFSAKNAGIYGSAVCRCDHFFHRGEPEGIDVLQVLDPLAVAWDAHAPSLLQSKVIVVVELWDTADAEAHFSFLTSEKIEELPTGGEKWSKLRDWDSSVMLNSASSQVQTSAPAGFLTKTLITWVWYQDSERIEEPATRQVVVPDEEGNEQLVEQPIIDEKTGKQEVKTRPVYPNGRLIVMAGEDRIVYDGHNPYMHGKVPLGVVDYCPQLGNVFAMPYVKSVLYQQQLINESISQVSMYARITGNPAIEVDDTALEKPEDVTNEPGKVYHKTRPGSGRAILPVEYAQMNSSVLQNYQIASAALERISGISTVSSGQAAAADSGIKVARLDAISERKLEPIAQSVEEMLRRIGQMFLWNINQFTSKFERMRYVTDTGDIDFVDLGDILDDVNDLKYDIIVETAPSGMTPRQRLLAESAAQSQQGILPPSLPLNWSDVPGTQQYTQTATAQPGFGQPAAASAIPKTP